MNTWKTRVAALAVAAGLVLGMSGVAHANVVEIDSPLGNDTAFLDTNTGMQWLDLSVTFNQSFDDVSAEFGDGGRYQGFRYASLNEVYTLLGGLGLQFSENEIRSETQFQLLESFLTLMGVPSGIRCCDAATIRPAYGLTNTLAQSPNPGDPAQFFWASFLQTTANGYAGSPPNTLYNAAWVEPQSTRVQSGAVAADVMGSWLVSAVPEPETYAMMLAGLGLVGWGARRRQVGE